MDKAFSKTKLMAIGTTESEIKCELINIINLEISTNKKTYLLYFRKKNDLR